MTRKSPVDFEIPAALLEVPQFSEDVLERILNDARVKVAPGGITLHRATLLFLWAYGHLHWDQIDQARPTARASYDYFKQIRDRATSLRKLLCVVDRADLEGTEAFPIIVDGVSEHLSGGMRLFMRERLARESGRSGRQRSLKDLLGADEPENALLVLVELLDLIVATTDSTLEDDRPAPSVRAASPVQTFTARASYIYLELTGQTELSTSRSSSSGKVGGPLIRFLEGCCLHVGEEVQRETLALWIRTWHENWRGKDDLLGLEDEEEADDSGKPLA